MKRRVTVVGGGASGLAAAIAAAENGAAVTLLERNPRVGKKILLTGNGRCNLGHAGFEAERYHGTLPQAAEILQKFRADAYFSRMGLYIREDSDGRLYPMSNAASAVLDALRMTAERCGVQTVCDTRVTGLTQTGRGYRVLAGAQSFDADAVVLAAGGSAAPNCGTDGNLLPVLRKMGYDITEPKPALCPVPTDPQRVRALKGIRVRAAVSAVGSRGVMKTETGELQFTEQALSGICVFNLSRLAAIHAKELRLSVDLLPDFTEAQAAQMLDDLLSVRGGMPCGELLTGVLPKRIGEQLCKQMFGSANVQADAALRDAAQKHRLLHLLRHWEFPVAGQAAFSQAQVTAGGVHGRCVRNTLESKLHKGLWFCGELLDLDGDCGGYNLAWAWSSGQTAGRNAAKA